MAGLVPAIHVLRNCEMPTGYVYMLANKPNGILYIGVTSDPVVAHTNIEKALLPDLQSGTG